MQPSFSMKHSFSPARSSIAERTLPADPYFALLVKLATLQSGRNFEREELRQSSSGERKVSRIFRLSSTRRAKLPRSCYEVTTGSRGKRPCPRGRQRDRRGGASDNRQRARLVATQHRVSSPGRLRFHDSPSKNGACSAVLLAGGIGITLSAALSGRHRIVVPAQDSPVLICSSS